MDVWPGAADEDMRRLSLEKMDRVMGIAADLGSKLVVMHFNYDPIYYRQQFGQWLDRAAQFFSTLLRRARRPAHRPGKHRRAHPPYRPAADEKSRSAAPGPLLRFRPSPCLCQHPFPGMAFLSRSAASISISIFMTTAATATTTWPWDRETSTGRRPRRPSPACPALFPSPWSPNRRTACALRRSFTGTFSLPIRAGRKTRRETFPGLITVKRMTDDAMQTILFIRPNPARCK